MILDLFFLSGKFFDPELPADKQYLFKYFKTDIQQQFIKYYFLFGNYDNYVDHTGLRCQDRWLIELVEKVNLLEKAKSQARKNFDLELVTEIETGRYKIPRVKK